MRPAILALLLVLIAAAPARADDTPIVIRAIAWLPEVKGSIRADENAVTGSGINFDLLNTEKNEAAYGGSIGFPLFWGMRGHVDFWKIELAGRTTLTAPLIFGGSIYTAGTRVDSNHQINMSTATLEYDHAFQIADKSAIRLSGLIGVRWINFEAKLKSATSIIPFTETQNFSIFLPTVGARAHITVLPSVSVDLMAQWFSAGDIEDREVDTFEFMGGASYTFFQGAYVGAGYRFVDLDIKDASKVGRRFDLNIELEGLYFELGYRF